MNKDTKYIYDYLKSLTALSKSVEKEVKALDKTKEDVSELKATVNEMKSTIKELKTVDIRKDIAGISAELLEKMAKYHIVHDYWYFGDKKLIRATGYTGEKGYTPIKGKDYFDGKDGANGKDGKDGKNGLNGRDGKDGKDGLNGKDGKDGIKGLDGGIPNVTIGEVKTINAGEEASVEAIETKDGIKLNFYIPRGISGRGMPGKNGEGIATGGTTNQVLAKKSNTDYDTKWIDNTGGGDSRSIESITLTETLGLVDTYTITYTDETTSTFDITNGADGEDGAAGTNGTNGTNGVDGDTPYIEGGYWYIDGTSTGVLATGPKGDKGDTGSQGIQGIQGPAGTNGTNGTNGLDGTDGTDAAEITSAAFDGNDIKFTKDDATTFSLTNAKITLKGEKGDTGDTGLTGATGATGAAGTNGANGKDGADGADGLTTSVNGVTQVAGAITIDPDDLDDTLTAHKFVTATDLTNLGNLSGTNSGDNAVNSNYSSLTQYTDEMAQDAVGTILTDSTEIDFTYTDETPSITASIKSASIDETKLDTSVNASLDLADSALQSETDPVFSAWDKDYNDLTNKVIIPASAYASIQAALDAVETLGGGIVTLANGTHNITTTLEIASNTTLLGIGNVIIKRMSTVNAMIINKADGITGAYVANENITLENITFDTNNTGYSDVCTSIAFGHANNITVKNCRVIDFDSAWHELELNGCRNVTVENCDFEYEGSTEALQLDIMLSDTVFPWFGPYDDTTNELVYIKNCRFTTSNSEYAKAIGNHSFAADCTQNKVFITECYFEGFKYAINLQDTNDLTIDKCNFVDNIYAIYQKNESNNVSNWNIIHNQCNGGYISTYTENRFFTANENASLNSKTNSNFNISGNNITNCYTHGIAGTFDKNINISNNKIYSNGKNGIYIFGGDNVLITGNSLYDNYKEDAARADIVVGGNSGVSSDNVNVNANNLYKGIIGTYATKVLFQNNFIITSLTNNGGAEGIYIDNIIAGVLQTNLKQTIFGSSLTATVAGGETKYVGTHMAADAYVPGFVFASAGTIRNLRVYTAGGAPGAGQSYTFTIMINNSASAITCTNSGTSTNTVSDLTNSATVAATNRISLRCVWSATAATRDVQYSFEFYPS